VLRLEKSAFDKRRLDRTAFLSLMCVFLAEIERTTVGEAIETTTELAANLEGLPFNVDAASCQRSYGKRWKGG
jgi:hypothetical protein